MSIKSSTTSTKPISRLLNWSKFLRVNRLFVLSFENTTDRTKRTKYYHPTVEIKDHNVIIDGQNLFDQPVKSNLRTYDRIKKIVTGQWDYYTVIVK